VFTFRQHTTTDFIHTQKRNPQTNLKDANMFWDFLSLTPESIHQVTILFSDRGVPKDYRHMNGYSSHTFKLVNKEGKQYWVKFHFKTEQGIENLTQQEADRLAAENPDWATEDLFNAIAKGKSLLVSKESVLISFCARLCPVR